MKLRRAKPIDQAFTLLDALIIVIILAIFAVMLMPTSYSGGKKATKIACTNNLKQIGLARMLWAGDHGDLYPPDVSVTNGGTKEIFSHGSPFRNIAFLDFLAISNELATPNILRCPSDTNGFAAAGFSAGFCNQNISYFIGLDADRNSPQGLVSGDDNFEIAGVPLTSGFQELSSNAPISWTTARHIKSGNILLGDGSVQSTTSSSLRSYLQQTTLTTNRIIIP